MSAVDFGRVRAVFRAVRHLPPVDWDHELDARCGGDGDLRAEVASLLAHDRAQQESDAPIEAAAPVSWLREAMRDAAPESLPRAFGPYELLEVIGRGGMGTVYRARQSEPDRLVAVKRLRSDDWSPALRRRFEYEAEVLGRLQHPGIASIYEAGRVETPDGPQPYFAMELVDGVPIDDFARRRSLDLRACVALVAEVADAMQHAHARGVIHRDLKPPNILVDESGRPRVLDFGIARATDGDVRRMTRATAAAELLGTLPYMSPEQVGGDAGAVDVRTDVYALGVVLYELLAGRLPVDVEDVELPEAVRRIADVEPPRLGSARPECRGDVETIVATALEKDLQRRYGSAAALAADLRRWLADEPIRARPASMSYQLRRFARRHRVLVAAGAIAATGLVVSTVVSTMSAVAAARAADREHDQRLLAEGVADELRLMLSLPSPHREGDDVTVLEMLDLMLARLDAGAVQPEIEAEVRVAIGKTYVDLGRTASAIPQLERGVALMTPGAVRSIARLDLARSYLVAGRLEEAEAVYRRVLDDEPEASLRTRFVADVGLSGVLEARNQLDDCRDACAALVATAEEHGFDDLDVFGLLLRRLARVELGAGHLDASLAWAERAVDFVERHLPADHPAVAATWIELAQTRRQRGQTDGAADAVTKAWGLTSTHRTPGSRDWMIQAVACLEMLRAAGRLDELVAVTLRIRDDLARTLGPDDYRVREAERLLARNAELAGVPAPRALTPTTRPE